MASGMSAKATTSPARDSVSKRRGERNVARSDMSCSGVMGPYDALFLQSSLAVALNLLKTPLEAVAPRVRDDVGRLSGEINMFGSVLPQQEVVQEAVGAGGVAVVQGLADLGDPVGAEQPGQFHGLGESVRGEQLGSPSPVVINFTVNVRQQGTPDVTNPVGGQRRCRPRPQGPSNSRTSS
jgi:hypothetical protein